MIDDLIDEDNLEHPANQTVMSTERDIEEGSRPSIANPGSASADIHA